MEDPYGSLTTIQEPVKEEPQVAAVGLQNSRKPKRREKNQSVANPHNPYDTDKDKGPSKREVTLSQQRLKNIEKVWLNSRSQSYEKRFKQ